ncbi:hypothetical protein [Bradyrhizobium sp. dw_78]|uniref:hypothetical protein n=1 Tax=Bradyrhizobium sp. dw_78 TaxID=2719793 RepID=UPI00201C2B75|nr:hypothetical protein [Bradyrhizobium sp. dw_78]
MSNAYIIEVRNRTVGIVTSDEHGFRFFSSERAFDSIDGHEFHSPRDAERAASALIKGQHDPAGRRALPAMY